jgi:hypothetical protein
MQLCRRNISYCRGADGFEAHALHPRQRRTRPLTTWLVPPSVSCASGLSGLNCVTSRSRFGRYVATVSAKNMLTLASPSLIGEVVVFPSDFPTRAVTVVFCFTSATSSRIVISVLLPSPTVNRSGPRTLSGRFSASTVYAPGTVQSHRTRHSDPTVSLEPSPGSCSLLSQSCPVSPALAHRRLVHTRNRAALCAHYRHKAHRAASAKAQRCDVSEAHLYRVL